MSLVWSNIDVYTVNGETILAGEDPQNVAGRGPVVVRESTNDDDDDGEPDAEIATWFLRFADLAAALRHTGVTRFGIWGHEVSVRVDGVLLERGLTVNQVPDFLAEIATNRAKAVAFERERAERRRRR